MIEKVLYLRPVVGSATACGTTDTPFRRAASLGVKTRCNFFASAKKHSRWSAWRG